MKKVLFAGALTCALVIGACAAKKDTDKKTSPEAEAGNEVSQGLTKISNGMGSAMSNASALAGATTRSVSPLTDEAELAACTDSGSAYASGDTDAPAGSPARNTTEWTARNIFCNLRKSPDGPDTIRGAMDRVKGFICAVGDLTYDGTEREVDIYITTDCFSENFVQVVKDENIPQPLTVKVTGYDDVTHADMGGNAGYDNAIKIDLASAGEGIYKIQFTAGASKFSTQMLALKQDGSDDWWASFTMDTTTPAASTLRLEGRFNGNNDDPNSKRYLRGFVEGETTDGEFTNPSNVEVILFDVYAKNGSNPVLPDSIVYNTLKGNATDGYQVWMGSNSENDDADYSSIGATITGTSECFGDGPCTGNAGHKVDAAGKGAFVKGAYSGQPGYLTFAQMFSTKSEFTFTSLSFDAHLN